MQFTMIHAFLEYTNVYYTTQVFFGKYLYINDRLSIGGPPTSSSHSTFLKIIAVPIWHLFLALPHPSPRTAN